MFQWLIQQKNIIATFLEQFYQVWHFMWLHITRHVKVLVTKRFMVTLIPAKPAKPMFRVANSDFKNSGTLFRFEHHNKTAV